MPVLDKHAAHAIVAPGEVLGFDLSDAAIAEAIALAEQSGIGNVRFEVGDLYEPDLDPERFDVAHFSGVLAHLSDPRRALRLTHRALKCGGLLAAREPQKAADWFAGPYVDTIRFLNKLTIEDWQTRGGDPWLGRDLGTLLRDVGFDRVEVTPGYAPALSNSHFVAEFASRRPDRAHVRQLGCSRRQGHPRPTQNAWG